MKYQVQLDCVNTGTYDSLLASVSVERENVKIENMNINASNGAFENGKQYLHTAIHCLIFSLD